MTSRETAGEGAAASPLVQTILSGTAPPQVRLAAARGALPLSRSDLLRVLVCLASDTEDQVRETARTSLSGWRASEVVDFASDPDTPADVLAFLLTFQGSDDSVLASLFSNASTPVDAIAEAARTFAPAAIETLLAAQTRLIESPRLLDALEANGALTPLQRSRIEEIRRHFLAPAPRRSKPAPAPEPPPEAPPPEPAARRPLELPQEPAGEAAAGEHEGTPGTYQRILLLNVNEKITLASRGDREERLILIRDSNRSVQEAVIGSPKITEQEVETIAKMRSVKDHILRRIAARRDWMKNYGIVKGLANNPSTPLPVSLELLKRLTVQDLKTLVSDRNLPDTLRRMAKKTLDQRLSRAR